jgi:signal transduction histidine kinase/ligand-binding sensor domain-containing protein/AraC-like DNA-binding protein
VGNDKNTYWDDARALRSGAVALALFVLTFHPLFAQDQLLPVFLFQKVDGLPNEELRSGVLRDPQGFVWFGTYSCLCKYDGYVVKEYRNNPRDPHSISSNTVHGLLVDREKRFWLGTHESGLSLFDPLHDRFVNFKPRLGDSSWYQSQCIASLLEDRSGNIWMATVAGGVVRVEVPPGKIDVLDSLVRKIHFTTYPLGTPNNTALGLLEREDGKMLIGSDRGVIVLDPATHGISRLHMRDPLGRRLDSLNILSMIRDSHGDLWVGTETDGLFRVEWNTRKVENFRHGRGADRSLKSDYVYALAEDREGNLWVASEGGVDLISPVTGQCTPYLAIGSPLHWPAKYLFLSVDSNAVLWLGTGEGGLYRVSPKFRRFPLYGLRDKDGQSPISFTSVERDGDGACWFMSSNGILRQIDIDTRKVLKAIDVLHGKTSPFWRVASLIDRSGIYWYGTWGLGLFRVDLRTGHVKNYNVEAGLYPTGIVSGIAQGEGDTLWIGSYQDGLMKFSPTSGQFTKGPALPAGDVFTVCKDHTGRIWIGSEISGVFVLEPNNGSVERLQHDPSDPRSLSSGFVHCICEDNSGRIWVGAGADIDLWDPATRSFTRYENPGFTHSLAASPLGSDRRGRLWIKYEGEGVAILDPPSGNFTNLDLTDGIDSRYMMVNLPDGRIVLPNWCGINIFNPDSIHVQHPPPPLVITRMSINDERAVPPQPLGTSSPLQLSHSQNVLEFEFAAIDIDAPRLVEYQYQLEGLEKEWVKPENRRFVRYPGLPPGDYIFRVKAATTRREWPEQGIALAISITPPWWRTTFAYALYGLFVLAILFGGYRLRLRQIRLTQNAEMEHFQAEHLAEVDRLKSRFFANISHEFRTPLTLILGPADQVIEVTREQQTRQKLHVIKENASKLFGLVNQLLDFARLEGGMMRLQVSSGDVVQFLHRVVMSFDSWAERKKINLEFRSEVESADGFFDSDKLEKIVNNLMSNALKFTPEGGAVVVQVTPSPSPPVSRSGEKSVRGGEGERARGGEGVTITVTDTGTGIAPEHLPHIFDRFYRVDETHTTEGAGIGLALTKELVDLHHGSITVESTPGRGSVFTVTIPIEQFAYTPNEMTESAPRIERREHAEAEASSEEPGPIPITTPADGKPIVLIVEDNADLRTYIREYLEADYAVWEAGNGKEGYDQAAEIVPDLVISDIMMPEMDGMELCRALKQDVRTSHVPVILLTALAGADSKIEGLETGADDYVTKPFDAKELGARVRNLIEQRRQLRKQFSEGVVLKPGEVAVSSIDDSFLKKVMASIETNIGDENFGVDDLAREACLSRAHLNRKLQALTDLSPAELIRQVRLERARQLLEKNAGSIAEIAYQVGFGSPSHFSASFRERFGILPSEVHRR